MKTQRTTRRLFRLVGGLGCLGLGSLGACGVASAPEAIGTNAGALGTVGGAQACIVGTTSLLLSQQVTTSGGIATNSLDMESGAVATGPANINNVGGAVVRISGATIQGPVSIAGAAPSAANGELINGGKIVGTVTTGAGLQATLPTITVTPGTTVVTANNNSPAQTIPPGNYGAVTLNGGSVTFTAGTYDLASLTINGGATLTFDTSAGAIAVNVQGTITVTGGVVSAAAPEQVTFYSNSSASNAVSISAGVKSFPGTISAPNGGLTIGSGVVVNGCVGAKTVAFEPGSSATNACTCIGGSDSQGNVIDPATTFCGLTICGEDFHNWACETDGWTPLGTTCVAAAIPDAGCTCVGGGDSQGNAIDPATTFCGLTICGADFHNWECETEGWTALGTPCGAQDAGCTCIGGGDSQGNPIDPATTFCGLTICGADFHNWECDSNGWEPLGTACANSVNPN